MTAAAVEIAGLTALKRLDPDEAALATLALRLLNGIPQGEGCRLSAERVDPSPDGVWLLTESRAMIRIDRLAGKRIFADATRLTEIATALDHLNPCLNRLEADLGLSLDAVGAALHLDNDSLAFRIAALGADNVIDQITLLVPRDAFNRPHMQAALAVSASPPDRIPCLVRPSLIAAALPLEDAAGLDAGDLILIANHAVARLEWDGGQCGGGLTLSTGQFQRARQDRTPSSGDPMTHASGQAGGGLSVPLTVSLPAFTTSAETLAALAPGSVLPLGPITDGMPVIVSVGGRELARGELVQVGDRFAVLVESRSGLTNETVMNHSEA